MALTVNAGTVEVWIKARTSALTTGLTKAQSALKSFSNGLQSIGTSVRRLGMQFTMAGGAITATTAGLLKIYAGFEQAMANTFSVLGQVDNRLTDFARTMGETTVFSAREAANAMYDLASTGLKSEQIIETLPGILNLAAATQYGLSETTSIVTSALNQFALSASESNRVANVFAAAIANSKATIDKLGLSMMYIGPLARQLNWSIEETTAILGKLYDAGYEASTAGTALRMGMAQLLSPTGATEEALERLGVTLEEVNPTTHKLSEILRTLAIAGMTAKDAIDIFGIRAGPAMLSLISQGVDSIDELEQAITGTNKASEMAAIQLDTVQGKWRLLMSALQELAISIAETIAPIIKNFIETTLIPIVNNITAWIKAHPKLVENIMKLVAGLGILLTVGGSIFIVLGSLLSLLGAILAPIVAIVGFLGPLGLLIVTILGIGGAFGILAVKAKDVIEFVKTKFAELRDYIKGVWDSTGATTNDIWERIFLFLETILNDLWVKGKEYFNKLVSFVKEQALAIYHSVSGNLKEVKSTWIDTLLNILQTVEKWANSIDEFFKAIGVIIKDPFKFYGEWIAEIFGNVLKWIKTNFIEGWTVLFNSFLIGIKDWWANLKADINATIEWFKNALEIVYNFGKAKLEALAKVFVNIKDKIVGALQSVVNWLKKVLNTIKALPGWVIEKIKGVAGSIGEQLGVGGEALLPAGSGMLAPTPKAPGTPTGSEVFAPQIVINESTSPRMTAEEVVRLSQRAQRLGLH